MLFRMAGVPPVGHHGLIFRHEPRPPWRSRGNNGARPLVRRCEVVETGKHRVALGTGGGRGVGRALALALAAEGAAVAVVSRTGSELDETAQAILDGGGEAVPIVADVTRPAEVARAVEEARTLGPIELLINNAGVGGPIGPMWEGDPGSWWVEINLRASSSSACGRGGGAVRPLHHRERRPWGFSRGGGDHLPPRLPRPQGALITPPPPPAAPSAAGAGAHRRTRPRRREGGPVAGRSP
jgi:hypothetical protein